MRSLPRTLGLRDLTLLTVGSVIGSGIFLVPGGVLRQAGGFVVPAMLVWLVGGVLVRAGVGLGIVLLGAPAYMIWRRRGEGAGQSSTGEETV